MDQTKDAYSFANDIAPKVRKPYAITRQREKWTEGEHRRFLEALKLYGRSWRQIEERVGTKTAVQIRSHAQKFFSKVACESNENLDGSASAIENPPPRPKRKPIHPYPRKSLNTKGPLHSYQSERSPSPNSSSMEKETGSPSSVLSAICSEGQQSGLCSPISCTTEMPSISLVAEGKSSQANEGDELRKECFRSTRRKLPSMVFDSKPKRSSSPDGTGDVNAPVTYVKLLGRTVMVAEFENPMPRDTNNDEENPTIDDHNKLDELSLLNENQDTELSLGKIYSSSSPLSSVQSTPNITHSTGEAELRGRNVDSIDSEYEYENKPCEARKGRRGFVLHKSCAAECKVKSDEQQVQRARVCL